MRHVTYIIPASLIFQAKKFFRNGKTEFRERMVFVTGIKFSPELIILTQLVRVKPAMSSAVGVTPDIKDMQKKQHALSDIGMSFLAQWHDHPGEGILSTSPSSTDKGTVARWEQVVPFIGAIFSEGGRYVRFFNVNQISLVQIYGSGVVRISESVFEISQDDRDGSEPEPQPEAGGESVQPANGDSVLEPAEDKSVESRSDWRRWFGW